VDRHLGGLGNALVQTLQESAAASQDDALVHECRRSAPRSFLDRVLDRLDDERNRRLDGFAICSPPTSTLRGKPVRRSRPRSVTRCASHSPGAAELIAILMSSAVRSPGGGCTRGGRRQRCRRSISSPPTRMLRLTTMPAQADDGHFRRAAADVDDHAARGLVDRQAPRPIAAAIGSSMSPAQRAPALRAASRTARFSIR